MVKILVVDDDEQVRDLALRLKGTGIETYVASSGEEALEMINGSYDVAVVDLGLPGTSGTELLAEMSVREDLRSIRRIAMTSRATPEEIMTVLEMGVSDFLLKPFVARAAQERIELCVSHGRQLINCKGIIDDVAHSEGSPGAVALLHYLYTRRPRGFVGLDDDCQQGVAKGNESFFVIKRFEADESSIARQLMTDSEQKKGLNIANIIGKAFHYENWIYILERYVPGVESSDMLLFLSACAQEAHAPLKEILMKRNIDDLVKWQKNYADLLPGTPDPEEIMGYYVSNMKLFLQRCSANTRRKVYGGRDVLFAASLSLFGLLKLDEQSVVRNLDNAPQNSGIRFICTSKKKAEEAADCWIKSPDPDKWIAERFYHWDSGHKRGHELEDFLSFYDSYEAKCSFIDPSTGRSDYDLLANYLAMRHGPGFNVNPVDIIVMGYYRNTRKRDLVIEEYYRKNEELFKGKHKIGKRYEYKRDDYVNKVQHYDRMAQYYAKCGFALFLGDEPKHARTSLSGLREMIDDMPSGDADAVHGIDVHFAKLMEKGKFGNAAKFLYMHYISRLSEIRSHTDIILS